MTRCVAGLGGLSLENAPNDCRDLRGNWKTEGMVMAEVYRPAINPTPGISSRPLNGEQCQAGVWSKDRWAEYYQCQRKPAKDGWCKQHHPEAEAVRKAAADTKYNAETRKWLMGAYGERMMAALIKIRDGDNDPRATAADALAGIKYANAKP